MIDALAKAEIATFSPYVGQLFDVFGSDTDNAVCAFTLASLTPLGNGMPGNREPFSLIFEGPDSVKLPQGTYQLRNQMIGELPIFIVPISERGGTRRYQAIFN
jgi:hypothetical protein